MTKIISQGFSDMTAKSDAFEVSIYEQSKQKAPHLTVEHCGANVHLSDIKLKNHRIETHIEVKMSGAQFGTPRLKFENNKWSGVESNYITNNISNMLNDDNHVSSLLNIMVDEHSKKYSAPSTPWIGYKRTHYRDQRDYYNNNQVDTVNIGEMLDFKTIVHVLKNINQNQTVLWSEDSSELIKMVHDYYIHKGANYLQAGDNFYALSHEHSDEMKIDDKVPDMKGEAKLTVRFSVRRTHQWIEIIPTIKLHQLEPSPYSLKPNTTKASPFVA